MRGGVHGREQFDVCASGAGAKTTNQTTKKTTTKQQTTKLKDASLTRQKSCQKPDLRDGFQQNGISNAAILSMLVKRHGHGGLISPLFFLSCFCCGFAFFGFAVDLHSVQRGGDDNVELLLFWFFVGLLCCLAKSGRSEEKSVK